jgi:DNA-binding LytR/AlgR family response regulator
VTGGLRILAVDDEPLALDDLADLLRAQDVVGEVVAAGSGTDALQILAATPFDAVFVDVRMPTLDGVELARVLRRFAAPPALVFVSAYESAAVEAFELRAVDYLMKPVSSQRIGEALTRVSDSAPLEAPATEGDQPADAESEVVAVDMPRGGETRLLPRASILYLQAHGDYVRVFSTEGRFLLRGRLVDLERRWAAHGFVRVHRKFMVNLRQAVALRRHPSGNATIAFPDGSEVPIARRNVAELRRRLSP